MGPLALVTPTRCYVLHVLSISLDPKMIDIPAPPMETGIPTLALQVVVMTLMIYHEVWPGISVNHGVDEPMDAGGLRPGGLDLDVPVPPFVGGSHIDPAPRFGIDVSSLAPPIPPLLDLRPHTCHLTTQLPLWGDADVVDRRGRPCGRSGPRLSLPKQ